jgi:predicted Zn-dependent peptidase
LFVLAELRDGAEPERVEAAVRQEVAALIQEGVGKKDLQRIRAQIHASFVFQDEAVIDLAMKLARFEALAPDGHRALASVLPTYDSLTNRELRETAGRFLQPERSACVWSLPEQGARQRRAAQRGRRRRQ